MSASDLMRKMLDEMMGTSRDGEPDPSNVLHFDSPTVCKSFLLGMCPYDLFHNTVSKKRDLGACNKVHDPALKADYELELANGKEFDYEPEHLSALQHFIDDCDRKVTMHKRRLEDTQDPESLGPEAFAVHGINEQIGIKLAEAEELGAQGLVEESMVIMKEIEALKVDKRRCEDIYRQCCKEPENQTTTQQQKLRVCEICAAFLSLYDNDRRLSDHFGGRLHMGFVKVRERLAATEKIVEEKRAKRRAKRDKTDADEKLARDTVREERRRDRDEKERSDDRDSKCDRDRGDKDRGDKDRGDKDRGDKDRRDKDRSDRDRGDKDRRDRDRGDKDRSDRDRGDKDRSDRDRSDRDRGDKDHSDRDRSDKGRDREREKGCDGERERDKDKERRRDRETERKRSSKEREDRSRHRSRSKDRTSERKKSDRDRSKDRNKEDKDRRRDRDKKDPSRDKEDRSRDKEDRSQEKEDRNEDKEDRNEDKECRRSRDRSSRSSRDKEDRSKRDKKHDGKDDESEAKHVKLEDHKMEEEKESVKGEVKEEESEASKAKEEHSEKHDVGEVEVEMNEAVKIVEVPMEELKGEDNSCQVLSNGENHVVGNDDLM